MFVPGVSSIFSTNPVCVWGYLFSLYVFIYTSMCNVLLSLCTKVVYFCLYAFFSLPPKSVSLSSVCFFFCHSAWVFLLSLCILCFSFFVTVSRWVLVYIRVCSLTLLLLSFDERWLTFLRHYIRNNLHEHRNLFFILYPKILGCKNNYTIDTTKSTASEEAESTRTWNG